MGESYHVFGLMSGTSLDGLDIAYCRFVQKNNNWDYSVINSITLTYKGYWKERLKNAHFLAPGELSKLNDEYGEFLGNTVKELKDLWKAEPGLIASHGHTIYHNPDAGVTYQLGNGKIIAEIVQLPVIYDFRSKDVALGGQGAPLVPVGDHYLFNDYDFCLNLGGFANISFLKEGKRLAFDICPVNFALNHLANQLGFDYDDGGRMAAIGTPDRKLLHELNSLPFYSTKPPKSLGREWFEHAFLPLLNNSKSDIYQKMNTVALHIAEQVGKTIGNDGHPNVLVTGGGALNNYLIELIKQQCTGEITIPSMEIVNYKEALIFAFLGVLKWRNEINVFSSVTGACTNSSSGIIAYP